jgi:hypothetical protein
MSAAAVTGTELVSRQQAALAPVNPQQLLRGGPASALHAGSTAPLFRCWVFYQDTTPLLGCGSCALLIVRLCAVYLQTTAGCSRSP